MPCCYSHHLRDLIGHKAIIVMNNCRSMVVICNITPMYIKAIEICSGNIKIFNLDHVDCIEECTC